MSKEYTGNDQSFLKACEDRGVAATKRQYSHWCNGRGLARGKSKAGRPIDAHGTER